MDLIGALQQKNKFQSYENWVNSPNVWQDYDPNKLLEEAQYIVPTNETIKSQQMATAFRAKEAQQQFFLRSEKTEKAFMEKFQNIINNTEMMKRDASGNPFKVTLIEGLEMIFRNQKFQKISLNNITNELIKISNSSGVNMTPKQIAAVVKAVTEAGIETMGETSYKDILTGLDDSGFETADEETAAIPVKVEETEDSTPKKSSVKEEPFTSPNKVPTQGEYQKELRERISTKTLSTIPVLESMKSKFSRVKTINTLRQLNRGELFSIGEQYGVITAAAETKDQMINGIVNKLYS